MAHLPDWLGNLQDFQVLTLSAMSGEHAVHVLVTEMDTALTIAACTDTPKITIDMGTAVLNLWCLVQPPKAQRRTRSDHKLAVGSSAVCLMLSIL